MPLSVIRGLMWERKWRKEFVIGISGLLVFLFLCITTSNPRNEGKDMGNLDVGKDLVGLTLIQNAKDRGAVCLDGSPPGYHIQKGHGSGSRSWVLHIEGGGWCNTLESCSLRKMTSLGSSNYMERQITFSGILSPDAVQNPDFYNWNRVKIRYCDGASLSGNVQHEVQNGTIFFRGQLIWKEMMRELLLMGLAHAKQGILSGCSAGGLAALIHCDDFRAFFSNEASVKCLADAAFFLDESDLSGRRVMQSFYRDVVNLQDVAKTLHKDCISSTESSKCFFPQMILQNVRTPVFVVNPAYDFWQIQNILATDASDPLQYWGPCKRNIHSCKPDQIEVLQGYRNSMLKALHDFQENTNNGAFINSCFIHCQTWMSSTWHSPTSPRINNKTIAEAVGDWYFQRREVKEIDCPYPCNPTCFNMAFY